MIARPSCRFRLNATKAQLAQIKLTDKDIDRPDRIVLAQIVIQPLGKQRALTAVVANNKARHRILPPKSQENHIIDGLFTQPGSKGEILARSRCFPLFTQQRTSPRYFGMSVSCHERTWRNTRHKRKSRPKGIC